MLESFLSQFWDSIRMAAGFKAVRRVGEQCLHCLIVKQSISRRKYALHFIIDDPVIAQSVRRCLNIIMPALLAQGIGIFINQRIKNSVQINIHQILKIFGVAAGNRIHSLIRISHCVQKSIH